MSELYIIEALTMFSLSLWKIYLGPIMGVVAGFSYFEVLLFNLSAAVISTIKALYFSDWLFERFKKKKKNTFNPKLRRFLRFWKKYGFKSTAILAPVLIGIPTSAIIANRLKITKSTIVYAHTLSSFFWCTLIYFATKYGANLVGIF